MRQIDNYQPKVSVIMPVRNEADFIERSLRAVFRQTYPQDLMEIIVADGESEDSTVAIVERFRAENSVPVQIVNNPKKIAPAGLNLAIRKAGGDIIIRVDGHCEIAPDYIALCTKHLQSEAADCIGGHIETLGENRSAQAIACAMSSKFGVGGSAFRCGRSQITKVDTVAFPGYRRTVFERIGFFNEELVRNQDDEFNYRLRKAGGAIIFAPEIKARYYSRSNYRSLWSQYFQYGYWKVRVFQMHPKQMSWRQFVPFLFLVSLLTSIVGALFFELGRIFLLILVSSYVLANGFASLFSTTRLRIRDVPRVMLSFAILHLAYGFGFLAGLITFRRRWKSNLRRRTVSEV